MTATPAEQRAAFRRMHASGFFLLPNAWDAGSAVRLTDAGFQALASTSAALRTQGSPVAWQHINLYDRYEFAKGPAPINLETIVAELAQRPIVATTHEPEDGRAPKPGQPRPPS